jgi:hypothetical protein
MSTVHQNWWFTTLLIRTSHFSDLLNGGQYLNCFALPLETSWESRDEDYEKYYHYFSNRRHFTLPAALGRLIGKPMLFSLTNAWAKFYQVDSHRKTAELKGEF